MFIGSVVKVPGTTSVRMWTLSEFEQEFGRAFDANSTFVSFYNGDGQANDAHVEGMTYQTGSQEGLYAVFDRTVTTNIRIGYFVYLVE